jgi:hypothetical protein
MHLTRHTANQLTTFTIRDAPPKYHDAIRGLAFFASEVEPNAFHKPFPADAAYLDRAFHRFQQHLEEIVQQAAGEIPVPWEAAFEQFLARTQHITADWFPVGSVPLALRGIPIAPGDVDLVVDAAGAQAWAAALEDVLIEPLTPVSDWFCSWWGRTFIGARVEWSGGIDPASEMSFVQDFYLPALPRLETVTWRGYDIRLPPIDLQLAIEEQRQRPDHIRLIRAALG